ncbi:MAG: metallophosphoesterase, partial [Gemmataceae bacterium]
PEVYGVYQELLGVVPLALRTPNRILLSHSLPPASRLDDFDPAVLERDVSTESDMVPGGSVHALVWGRDTRPETVAAFLAKMDADLLISGHVPCDDGFDTPNDRQLILDSLGSPACYCLFPTDRVLTLAELVPLVQTL